MSWLQELILDRAQLMPPAEPDLIDRLAKRLGVRFPRDYREFLEFADGGILPEGNIIIYSAGNGVHPSETLLAANERRPADFPLLLVARDAYEEYGFSKAELAELQITDRLCTVYVFLHETETVRPVAPSFAEFLRARLQIARAGLRPEN